MGLYVHQFCDGGGNIQNRYRSGQTVPFSDRFAICNKGDGEYIRVTGVVVLSTAAMVAEHHQIETGPFFVGCFGGREVKREKWAGRVKDGSTVCPVRQKVPDAMRQSMAGVWAWVMASLRSPSMRTRMVLFIQSSLSV